MMEIIHLRNGEVCIHEGMLHRRGFRRRTALRFAYKATELLAAADRKVFLLPV